MHQSSDQHHSQLCELLIKAHRQLHEALSTALRESSLSVDQWRLLGVLADQQGHTVSELAKALGVKISGLSKNLDRLSERALLFRRQDDEDHRKINIFISDFGLELLKDCELKMDHFHRQLSQKLGPRDSKNLDRLLRKLSL